MNKLFLTLAILSAGTAGFVTARQSTNKLQREASATRESWIAQTQGLAGAQSEVAQLAERIRELKQNLRQAEAAGTQNGLWSVLETNRIGDLAPDLREHLLEELGFNWNSSEVFIVVSKETVRDIQMHVISVWPKTGDWLLAVRICDGWRLEEKGSFRESSTLFPPFPRKPATCRE